MNSTAFPKSRIFEPLPEVGSASVSPMGRRDTLEAPRLFDGTLRLQLLKMVDYCYDEAAPTGARRRRATAGCTGPGITPRWRVRSSTSRCSSER